MAKQIILTKDGYETLKRELDTLVNDQRPKLVDRLAYARSQGDLAENSDYTNAKEELEFLDGRIDELNEVVKTAVISDGKKVSGAGVAVGTKVTVKVNGNKVIFDVVGEWEADPVNKKISPESPLGKALFGKKAGEKVEVEAPAGKVTYEIVAVN